MTLLSASPQTGRGTLELDRVGPSHWLLQDNTFPPNDARHVIASLHATTDRDIEVVWLPTNLPSRTRYRTPGEVLHDVASLRCYSTSSHAS
ncbi:MAG: hypothetical protein ABW091_02785 [Microbacterium sp.]